LQEVKEWIGRNPDEFVILYFLKEEKNSIAGNLPSASVKRASVLKVAQNMFGNDRAFSNEWSAARPCSDFSREVATGALKGVYTLSQECINHGNYVESVSCKNSNKPLQSQDLPVCEQEHWQKMDDYLARLAASAAQTDGLSILQLHFQGMRVRYTERAFCVNRYIAEKLREPQNVEAFKGRPFFIQIDDIAHKGADEVVRAVAAIRAAR